MTNAFPDLKMYCFDEDLNGTLGRLKLLYTQLQRIGVSVPAGSRIAVFRDFIDGLNESTDPNVNVVAISEGNRDSVELALILEQLVPSRPSQLAKLLKEVLGGAIVASGDRRSFPRDIQFELYIAARFAQAGFQIELAEPDALILHGQKHFGIAAKRVSSPSQIRKRVRESIRQLDRANVSGFVAMSFDRLATQSDADPRIIARSSDALKEAAPVILKKLLQQYHKEIQPYLPGTSAIGFVASLTYSAIISGPGLRVGTSSIVYLLPASFDLLDADPVAAEIGRLFCVRGGTEN